MYTDKVHRALALLVVAAISVPLVTPLLLSAEPQAELPACCRRDGKHGCAKAKQATRRSLATEGSDGTVQSSKMTCPLFPSSTAAPVASKWQGAPAALVLTLVPPANAVVIAAEMEVRRRIACIRSLQKRGPPSQLA